VSDPIPCGYIRLTSSFDGRPFLLSARELVVMPGSGTHRASNKHPDGCLVGPVTDTETYWICAETFDEVQAALVAALGAQVVRAKANDALSKLPRIALFDLDISPRIAPKGAVRRLVGQGFGTVNDLAAVTRRDVAMCRNIGESTLRFCDAALAACGLNWKAKDRE
jgi:hypothetical protein